MPKHQVTDPNTGRTITMEWADGTPPSEKDIEAQFAAVKEPAAGGSEMADAKMAHTFYPSKGYGDASIKAAQGIGAGMAAGGAAVAGLGGGALAPLVNIDGLALGGGGAAAAGGGAATSGLLSGVKDYALRHPGRTGAAVTAAGWGAKKLGVPAEIVDPVVGAVDTALLLKGMQGGGGMTPAEEMPPGRVATPKAPPAGVGGANVPVSAPAVPTTPPPDIAATLTSTLKNNPGVPVEKVNPLIASDYIKTAMKERGMVDPPLPNAARIKAIEDGLKSGGGPPSPQVSLKAPAPAQLPSDIPPDLSKFIDDMAAQESVDHAYDLSRGKMPRLKQPARSDFSGGDAETAAAVAQGRSRQANAEVRMREGRATPKEIVATLKYKGGDPVTLPDGRNGTLNTVAFGKAQVILDDGTKISVPYSDLPKKKPK